MNDLAFTIEAGGILESIITPVSIRQSEKLCQIMELRSEETESRALWDTGANRSCISARLAHRLGLIRIDTSDTAGVGGVLSSFVHLADIGLPNRISIRNVRVTEFIDDDDFDVIIGMDILTCGDFALSNYGRKTVISFRIPSQKPPIDFREISV
jgi:hypothetical protein